MYITALNEKIRKGYIINAIIGFGTLTLIRRRGMSTRQNSLSGTAYGFTISLVRQDYPIPHWAGSFCIPFKLKIAEHTSSGKFLDNIMQLLCAIVSYSSAAVGSFGVGLAREEFTNFG
jgi:hypothetical protein